MSIKYLGAILVILGCGGFGFSIAAAHRREERTLRQLLDVLHFLYCELQFHLTPLPELCRQVQRQGKGEVGAVFGELADQLENQVLPEVSSCMHAAAAKANLSTRLRELLNTMGQTLGRFDLDGQLKGLEALRLRCDQEMAALMENRDDRLRSYQTLGLCAGAALVILFV